MVGVAVMSSPVKRSLVLRGGRYSESHVAFNFGRASSEAFSRESWESAERFVHRGWNLINDGMAWETAKPLIFAGWSEGRFHQLMARYGRPERDPPRQATRLPAHVAQD